MARMSDHMLIERWHSRNVDESVARLDTIFQRTQGFAAYGGPDKFWNTHDRLTLGELTLTRYAGSGVRFGASFGDRLHVGIPTRGSACVTSRKGAISTSPFVLGNTLPPNEAFALDAPPGGVTYAVEVPLAALAQQTEALADGARAADMIAASVDLQSGPGAALTRNVLVIFNELQTLAEAGLGPLAVTGFSEVLLNLLLAATLPKLRAELGDAPPRIAVATAERAREYLTAHAHEPMRIAELAAELGVGIRALQTGFRRLVGCSPRQYLFKCRLDLARTRLLSPGPMDTVSSIAIDCGFLNLGLFASRYRGTFGELPSQTLGRSRRALGLAARG